MNTPDSRKRIRDALGISVHDGLSAMEVADRIIRIIGRNEKLQQELTETQKYLQAVKDHEELLMRQETERQTWLESEQFLRKGAEKERDDFKAVLLGLWQTISRGEVIHMGGQYYRSNFVKTKVDKIIAELESETTGPTVHLMHAGYTRCGALREYATPAEWPEGHSWDPVEDSRTTKANCAGCLDAWKRRKE